jgi:adenylate cyclase
MEKTRIKLKPRTRIFLMEMLFIVVSVDILMYIYYMISWWGMRDYVDAGNLEHYVYGGYVHFEILIQGTIFGILFGLINFVVDNARIRRRSFGSIILIKSVFYVLAMAGSQYVVLMYYELFDVFEVERLREMQANISPVFVISIMTYFTLVVVLINFLLQINRKFGYGVLFSMLIGKYHKPRKENRIFMFLDMQDSTGNAERLGHFQYSRMIQTCINDLTDLIVRYKAQVYQYVGDEVVLTWPSETGLRDLNCISLFYAYEQRLNDRKDHYLKYFRSVPVFKAGMDVGSITVTEVGDIKREIAYHGDVLHTAARLEKLCNHLEQKILITESVQEKLDLTNGYATEYMGDYKLRGKQGKQKVFGISRP